jgi:CHAT domain-containing protein
VEQGTDLRLEAEIHRELGETSLARLKAAEALALHRASEAPVEQLQDRIFLAELAQMNGESSITRDHLRMARRLAEKTGAQPARAHVALATARISQRAGRNRSALRTLAEASADLAPGDYATAAQLQAVRSEAFRALGQLDSAVSSGYAAVDALERVRGALGSGTLRNSYLASKTAAYSRLVDILIDRGDLASAFEVADAMRGRALLEHLAAAPHAQHRTSTIQTLTAADEQLRRSGALVAELLDIETEPPRGTDSSHAAMRRYLVTQLEEARSSFEALQLHAAARDAPAAQLLSARRVSYGNTRAELRPNEALLEYVLGSDRVHLFLLTASGIRQYTVTASAEDLTARVRLARELVARPGAVDSAPPVFAALHDLLIRPALASGQLSGVRRLLIVPHAALAYLPFAALHDRDTGRYLMEDFSIVSLPSAAALPSLRKIDPVTAPSSGKSVSTVFAPYPKTLPATRLESEAFLHSVRGAHALLGPRATEEALGEALQEPGLIHLATHGRLNSVSPMFSRLELAPGRSGHLKDDGRLEINEVLGLRIRSPLVFLSGCETGLGVAWSNRYQPGEDYATLAQAFLYAGAGSVISTLWRIQDNGAAAFAERFYKHLGRAAPPEALALAQRDMLSDGRYGAPYYWASYQVAGRGELRAVAQK